MNPIFFTIGKLPLKIIPDTQAHLDGHSVITYNYNIFFDSTKNNPAKMLSQSPVPSSDKMAGPDYYGYITFEDPGKVFTYTPGENQELTRDEIEEIIERLNHYRDNPDMWSKNDN